MPVAAGRPTLGRGRGRGGGGGRGRGETGPPADAPKETEFNVKSSTEFLASTFATSCEEAKEGTEAKYYASKQAAWGSSGGGPAALTSADDFEAMMLSALSQAAAPAPA